MWSPPVPWCEDQAKDGGVVPDYTGMVNPHCKRVGMAGASKKPKDCVENITPAKKTTGYVTVNGINLMKL